MFQDEYVDLLSEDRVEDLAVAAYGVCEYLNTYQVTDEMEFDAPTECVTYHGHCNQKALNRDHHAAAALSAAGYDVDALDSSCCGMAGSFGYEEEHYELSKAIGEILHEKVKESPGGEVVAPGASCRSQLADDDFEGERPAHPVEKLHDALA